MNTLCINDVRLKYSETVVGCVEHLTRYVYFTVFYSSDVNKKEREKKQQQMENSFTYTVKLLCKLAIFCCYTGQISCDKFETNRCPSNLPKDIYLRVYGDKCYRFFTSEVSWTSARDHCVRTGGQLVSITRSDIQHFVERTLSEIWSKNGMWIGANDRDSEMDWFWVTGKKVSSGFKNWGSGQPSCLFFMCVEDCACLRLDDNYRWHDKMCSWSYGFACEYYLLPVPKPRIPKTTTKTTTATRKTTTSTTTTTTTTTPASTVLQTQSQISTETTEKELKTAYTKMTTVVNADTTSGPPSRANLSSLTGTTSDIVTTRLPVIGIVVGALIGVIVIVIMAVLLTITIQRKLQTSRVERRLTTQQRSKDGKEFAHKANTQASGMEMTESDYDTIGSYCYVDIDHRAGSVHAYKDIEEDTKHKTMFQMKET